ncbi:MAG: 30S ribosomal protein S19 [Candidatus Altiarchaeota archaeon]|nr:30S ribosomal protein S19 [Candidatus Altiarchaeota archaeon]
MAKKEFKYKGLTLEELKVMSMDKLVDIMPSRPKRTLKKGFTDQQRILIMKVREAQRTVKAGKTVKPIRTHCRDMPIIPEMVGLDFMIYNGKEFTRVEVKPEMIGQYLGEFALTRRPVKHNAPGVGATRSSLFVPIK